MPPMTEAIARLNAEEITGLRNRLLESAAFRASRPSPFRAAGDEPPDAEHRRLLGMTQHGKDLLRNREKLAAASAANPAQPALPVHLGGRPEPSTSRAELDKLLGMTYTGRGILAERRDRERKSIGLLKP
jgi:hypothetical protein